MRGGHDLSRVVALQVDLLGLATGGMGQSRRGMARVAGLTPYPGGSKTHPWARRQITWLS